MFSLLNLLALDTTSIILISVLVPVALIGIGIFLFFFLRSRSSKSVSELKKKYDESHSTLTSSCLSMVNRMGSLGKYSEFFRELYDDRKKQYDEILEKQDQDVENKLKSLDKLVEAKNHKEIKLALPKVTAAVDEYRKIVSDFNDELTNLLRDDTDTREASLSIKEKFRRIRDFYNSHDEELQTLSNSFNIIFSNSEKTFSEFEEYVNQAKFKDAKALLPQLDQILSAVLDVLDDLPALVTRIQSVIPNRLDDLERKYNEMVKENYVLDYLNVPEELKSMREKNAELADRLQLLDTTGIKQILDKMQSKITDILTKFDDEKEAKKTFSEIRGSLTTSTFELEKLYSRYVNSMNDYQRTYVLDRKYIDDMVALKASIEKIGFLKRDVESYVDTSAKQPYTIITKKVSEMQKEMKHVEETVNDYANYLETLKADSQMMYSGIRSYLVKLKKAEITLKEIGVDTYKEAVTPTLDKLYKEILSLDEILMNEPVNVSKAKLSYEPFAKQADELISAIENKYKECLSAQQSIVYANSYRLDYVDSRPLLDSAEQYFNEGDFVKSQDSALKVIKMFNPSNLNETHA